MPPKLIFLWLTKKSQRPFTFMMVNLNIENNWYCFMGDLWRHTPVIFWGRTQWGVLVCLGEERIAVERCQRLGVDVGYQAWARESNRQGQGICWWTPRSTPMFLFYKMVPWTYSAIRIFERCISIKVVGHPPKWQVLYTELRGSRCPVPRSRRTPGWFFAPWGLLGSTCQKTLGDVHLHRVTKKQHMQPMYLRKTWNLGISIYIWRHQLQDFNAQVASFAANRGVDRWIYHLSPVRQWNRPSGGSLSWGNVFFAASTFDVLFPCKWHSCVFA